MTASTRLGAGRRRSSSRGGVIESVEHQMPAHNRFGLERGEVVVFSVIGSLILALVVVVTLVAI